MSYTPPNPDLQQTRELGGGVLGALSSPSPTRGSTSSFLGLGFPSTSTPSQASSVLSAFPHLGHYIFNLLASYPTSPPRAASQHPLSVSSSGSDDELELEQRTPQKRRESTQYGIDREGLVRKIVELLDNEEEEEVKDLLRPHMGELGKVSTSSDPVHEADAMFQDDILMDQVCLDCMHRRRGESSGSSVTLGTDR